MPSRRQIGDHPLVVRSQSQQWILWGHREPIPPLKTKQKLVLSKQSDRQLGKYVGLHPKLYKCAPSSLGSRQKDLRSPFFLFSFFELERVIMTQKDTINGNSINYYVNPLTNHNKFKNPINEKNLNYVANPLTNRNKSPN